MNQGIDAESRLHSAITMVCNMLERDEKPARAEAAEELRNAFAARAVSNPSLSPPGAGVAAPVSQARETEMSKRLRQLAEDPMWADHIEINKATVLAAASEIERYYGGMLNWKATAKAQNSSATLPEAAAQEGDSTDDLQFKVDLYKKRYHEMQGLVEDLEKLLAAKQAQPVAVSKEAIEEIAHLLVKNSPHPLHFYDTCAWVGKALATHPQQAAESITQAVQRTGSILTGARSIDRQMQAIDPVGEFIKEGAQAEKCDTFHDQGIVAGSMGFEVDKCPDCTPTAAADGEMCNVCSGINGFHDERCSAVAPLASSSDGVVDPIGTPLNDACWAFIEAMPHELPGPIFNTLKPAMRAGIEKYLSATPAAASPVVVELPPLPSVGPICHASAVDILAYRMPPEVGTHLPGVRDVALWSTDQMRAYARAAVALAVKGE